MGEAEFLEGSGLDVSTTVLALSGRQQGVQIRCTQGGVVILKKGAEATGVGFGTRLHDTEWNPAPLDPPHWILKSTMEPSANIPVTA
jgi:hypothetical protein